MLMSGCRRVRVRHQASPTSPQRHFAGFVSHHNPCDSSGIMLPGLTFRGREGKRLQHRERAT